MPWNKYSPSKIACKISKGMRCINLSSKVLVTRMLFIYIEFFLIWAAMFTFLPLGFLPWTPQPLNSQTAAGKVPAQQRCQLVKALGSFQSMPTPSADINHLCEKFMMLAETAKYMYSSDAPVVNIVTWQRWQERLPLQAWSQPSLLYCEKSTPTFSHVTKCYFLCWERMKGHVLALQSIYFSLEAKLWVDRHTANCRKCLKICTKYIYIYAISQFSAA